MKKILFLFLIALLVLCSCGNNISTDEDSLQSLDSVEDTVQSTPTSPDSFNNMSILAKNTRTVAFSAIDYKLSSSTKSINSDDEIMTLSFFDASHPTVMQPLVFTSDKGNKVILEVSEAFSVGESLIACSVSSIDYIVKEPEIITTSEIDPVTEETSVVEKIDETEINHKRYVSLYLLIDVTNSTAFTITHSLFRALPNAVINGSTLYVVIEGTLYSSSLSNISILKPLNNKEANQIDKIHLIWDDIILVQQDTNHQFGLLLDANCINYPVVMEKINFNRYNNEGKIIAVNNYTIPGIIQSEKGFWDIKYAYDVNQIKEFQVFYIEVSNSSILSYSGKFETIILDSSPSRGMTLENAKVIDINNDKGIISFKLLCTPQINNQIVTEIYSGTIVGDTISLSPQKVCVDHNINKINVLDGYCYYMNNKILYKTNISTGSTESIELQKAVNDVIQILNGGIVFNQFITPTIIGQYWQDAKDLSKKPILLTESKAEIKELLRFSFD